MPLAVHREDAAVLFATAASHALGQIYRTSSQSVCLNRKSHAGRAACEVDHSAEHQCKATRSTPGTGMPAKVNIDRRQAGVSSVVPLACIRDILQVSDWPVPDAVSIGAKLAKA